MYPRKQVLKTNWALSSHLARDIVQNSTRAHTFVLKKRSARLPLSTDVMKRRQGARHAHTHTHTHKSLCPSVAAASCGCSACTSKAADSMRRRKRNIFLLGCRRLVDSSQIQEGGTFRRWPWGSLQVRDVSFAESCRPSNSRGGVCLESVWVALVSSRACGETSKTTASKP